MTYDAPKNSRSYRSKIFTSRTILVVLAAFALLAIATTSAFMAGGAGAIFTTNSACTGTNVNIYGSKDDVYLDGGPVSPGAAGLDDGSYYVRVTDPSGATLLGTSIGSGNDTPVTVTGGEFAVCYHLSAILIKGSDGTPGYDDTPSPGGEYKVWVSKDSTFSGGTNKTDNFKVQADHGGGVPQGTLNIVKFYDANANGLNDDGQLITGWRMQIHDNIDFIRFTPVSLILAPDDYVITESDPVETNWVHTTTNPVNLTLNNGDNTTVEFGNLCLGAGGGKTLGFWSNKNGQAQLNDGGTMNPEFALLTSLCLRSAIGTDFDPTSYPWFRTWLLNATATNMAYMLSAQLATMELNVEAGFVNGGQFIYAPGTNSANSLGFATVNAVMTEANTLLCAKGNIPSGDPDRPRAEALKNALDNANNNLNFVQTTPCPFTFAPLP
jgi:hypothetical protein